MPGSRWCRVWYLPALYLWCHLIYSLDVFSDYVHFKIHITIKVANKGKWRDVYVDFVVWSICWWVWGLLMQRMGEKSWPAWHVYERGAHYNMLFQFAISSYRVQKTIFTVHAQSINCIGIQKLIFQRINSHIYTNFHFKTNHVELWVIMHNYMLIWPYTGQREPILPCLHESPLVLTHLWRMFRMLFSEL